MRVGLPAGTIEGRALVVEQLNVQKASMCCRLGGICLIGCTFDIVGQLFRGQETKLII